MAWSCIITTCPSAQWAEAIQTEFDILKRKGKINAETVCLTVEDPGSAVGSGGATLNALLVVAEYYSSLDGYTTVTVDVLYGKNILVLHHGRSYLYDACGRGFVPVGIAQGEIVTNVEHLVNFLSQMKSRAPCGVWVSSTDMYLSADSDISSHNWEKCDAAILGTLVDVCKAKHHGVLDVDKNGIVNCMLYGVSEGVIDKHSIDGKTYVISGVVYLSLPVVENLISFHGMTPVGNCTYMGVDTGEDPVQLSLFFDILGAMTKGAREKEFCLGKYSEAYSIRNGLQTYKQNTAVLARHLIWKELHQFTLKMWSMEGGQYQYLSDELPLSKAFVPLLHHVPVKIGVGTASEESDPMETEENVAVIGFPVAHPKLGETVLYAILGTNDYPKLNIFNPEATVFGDSWSVFLESHGIQQQDLWEDHIPNEERCLSKAKLYPSSRADLLWLQQKNRSRLDSWRASTRTSLVEMTTFVEPLLAFQMRRDDHKTKVLQSLTMKSAFLDGSTIMPIVKCAVAEKWTEDLLFALDKAALESRTNSASARYLAYIAELLGCIAGPTGGVRSGPSANKAWKSALDLIEVSLTDGIRAMAEERRAWMTTPAKLVRAARHYEGAARALIRKTVSTATDEVHLLEAQNPTSWVTCSCPARIDMMGGWSDTPPICYEQGGVVVNAAILVDGKKPIGAKARRILEHNILLVIGEGESKVSVILNSLSDLRDYDNPSAIGALPKAALICAGIVHSDGEPLAEQLESKFQGGLEVHSWSNLPQGSGLGTSSILAGAIVAVLWTVSGKKYDLHSLIHAVLCLEQMLTTGGGWQDQVGGLIGGIKIGRSLSSHKMKVTSELVPVADSFIQQLNAHLLLLYTGKVRLARNLLQNVIRNWYTGEEETVHCFKQLVVNSLNGANAFREGNLEAVGHSMNIYWSQKKTVAPGCEPPLIGALMACMAPFAFGQMLTGAGGGGFMIVLTKEPHSRTKLEHILRSNPDFNNVSFHDICVDMNGLELTADGKIIEIPLHWLDSGILC